MRVQNRLSSDSESFLRKLPSQQIKNRYPYLYCCFLVSSSRRNSRNAHCGPAISVLSLSGLSVQFTKEWQPPVISFLVKDLA
jgi:hypothetical protein